MRQKVEKLWRWVEEVAQGKGKGGRKEEKEKVLDLLDRLLDVTTCPHIILLCIEENSGCMDMQKCKVKAHIKCNCPLESKVPALDLNWLAVQRAKRSEKSKLMMVGDDKNKTKKQQ